MVPTTGGAVRPENTVQSHDAEIVAALTRAHDVHALPPALRELADRFLYQTLGLLFPHFSTRPRTTPADLVVGLSTLRAILLEALGETDTPGTVPDGRADVASI